MPAPIGGGLLSSEFLASGLAAAYGEVPALTHAAVRSYVRDQAAADASLGPASGARAVLEGSTRALIRWLGWLVDDPAAGASGTLHATLIAPGAVPVSLVVLPWARDPGACERSAASVALAGGRRWLFLTNGRRLRIVDAGRVPSPALDCDLALCGSHADSLARLHLLAGPRSFQPCGAATVLDRARALSDVEGVRVCEDLREGVRAALATFERAIATRVRRASMDAAQRAQALTAVYRVLFLLFAEARGLVPAWHPIYRDGYTVAALSARLERRDDPRGTWAALQAMARLAHGGCAAGDLRVTAFNSRLFSPSASPLLDYLTLDDDAVAAALASLVFQTRRERRQRISYADLGVEQLGSVYECLLDDVHGSAPRASSPRKTSGSFYTPLPLTEYLVRVTLGPLVEGRDAAGILALRVLDPAMGSGAFLVAACRFLAAALERALVADGTLDEHEIDDADRARLRRLVAQRCLFGVDANPMAVQLAELSLWLATLAAEHPISFLEHHLRRGDSLIGARPLDVMLRPPGRRRGGAAAPLPLEPWLDAQETLAALLPARAELEERADSTADIVREKERALASLQRHPALVRWRTACDVWCALSIQDAASRGHYAILMDHVFGRASVLPRDRIAPALDRITSDARSVSAFHWPLEFPEVFLDAQGRPRPDGGFDAIIGNPPWEMLRADAGATTERVALTRFARVSGLYAAQGRGHTNAYQLFLERALTLLRPGGRLGMLVPSGLLTDAGSGPLRRLLVERHRFESAVVFDNRRAIFPIHRGLRFTAITAVHSGTTGAVRCRFGLDSAEQAAALDPATGAGFEVSLSPALLRALGQGELAFPDLPTAVDAALVERLVAGHPALSSAQGWCVTFGRELNATDDRDCLTSAGDPDNPLVIEGRHLEAFRVRLDRSVHRADRRRVLARLGRRAPDIDRPRLGYREVAAATNRTTLIAAIVPPGTVTVHTVFCCRERLARVDSAALCALLNSYVANYLARRWVTTHVTATVMSRLPVPRPDDTTRRQLARFAGVLARGRSKDIEPECQALCASAYRLTIDEFAHVLTTFPLVERTGRDAALAAFRRGERR